MPSAKSPGTKTVRTAVNLIDKPVIWLKPKEGEAQDLAGIRASDIFALLQQKKIDIIHKSSPITQVRIEVSNLVFHLPQKNN